MRVYSVPFIMVIILTTNIFSQVQFTTHTIATIELSTRSAYAVDPEGDEDIDVLSASHFININRMKK